MPSPLSSFDGTSIYLDAMVVAAYFRPESPWHEPSRQLIQRAVDSTRPVRLVTATLTIDEVVFVLLQELLLDPPFAITHSRSQYLATHPETVRRLSASIDPPLQAVVDVLSIEPVLPEDITEMRREMLATGTLPRDAIHLAVMRRLGLTAIATADEGFERCGGISAYRP
ncbi:MAG TPA: type II toxin-antitoxin system VapC family toxin [Chloroflexota bacterium]|nr:type II toxin-antitoxin system VapC family toxin [Chloroflexota bacterium]